MGWAGFFARQVFGVDLVGEGIAAYIESELDGDRSARRKRVEPDESEDEVASNPLTGDKSEARQRFLDSLE